MRPASVVMAIGLGLIAPPAHAEPAAAPDLTAYWRDFFKRPATIPAPADNPQTPAKIALGKRLFDNPLLSGDGNRACTSCHVPALAYSDGATRAAALDGQSLPRNTPSLYNLAWAELLTWDGHAHSLEDQAGRVIENPREMAGDWNAILDRIRKQPELHVAFHEAFAERPGLTPATVTKALAAYVRTLVSPETRFDRWVTGDDTALTAQELQGFRHFVGKAGCVGCHGGWRFTDDHFHDIGLKSDDPGRGAVPGGVPGLAAFKTPTLRELTRSAPYMHDGSLATLEAVVDHYAGDLVERPSLSASIVRNLHLEADEKAALVAFLKTLSSEPGAGR
jgi:cytochrome c peroxidase